MVFQTFIIDKLILLNYIIQDIRNSEVEVEILHVLLDLKHAQIETDVACKPTLNRACKMLNSSVSTLRY